MSDRAEIALLSICFALLGGVVISGGAYVSEETCIRRDAVVHP